VPAILEFVAIGKQTLIACTYTMIYYCSKTKPILYPKKFIISYDFVNTDNMQSSYIWRIQYINLVETRLL